MSLARWALASIGVAAIVAGVVGGFYELGRKGRVPDQAGAEEVDRTCPECNGLNDFPWFANSRLWNRLPAMVAALMRAVPVVRTMTRLRLRAAIHELRCRECRVTWRSWWQRLIGNPKGMTP